jgi:F420H(2)-dependent biliverdin reductase
MSTREQRLASEPNIWLATSRPGGKPHLTPIWFVYVEDSLWICTGTDAVKSKNIRANPAVSFALQDGNAPVTGEGTATLHDEVPPAVAAEFVRKFDWDITTDNEYRALFQITVRKWLHPGGTGQ